jgi:ArsR family transcriptional regulator
MNTTLLVSTRQPAEEERDQRLAELARALGHPHRVAIVRYLATTGSCVCGNIVEALPIAQSTVSEHLKKLKAAGWIRGEIDGPRVCYCLKPEALQEFKFLFDSIPLTQCC